jgi:hypothetical protein
LLLRDGCEETTLGRVGNQRLKSREELLRGFKNRYMLATRWLEEAIWGIYRRSQIAC